MSAAIPLSPPVRNPAAESAGVVKPAGPPDVVLKLQGISLSFGGVKAIDYLDLEVARGEVRAIIGPNGAGKSSVINVISGIYRLDRGTVRIRNRAYRQVPVRRLAHLGIARTFQHPALFGGLTVAENISAGRVFGQRSTVLEQLTGLGRARKESQAAKEIVDNVIRFLQLEDIRNRNAGDLSYGLRKRVELGRALAARPAILLLDEPMAGMTLSDKVEMTAFIRAARREFDLTIVLIEHDMSVVMNLSDKVAVLDYGRKIADGTPQEIQSSQAVIDAYLGVDYDSGN